VCRIPGCTRELDPVFCAIGYMAYQEYTNPCLAEEAGYDVDTDCYREGPGGPGPCPPIYDPFCCEGQQFNSGLCEAEQLGGYYPQQCLPGVCRGGGSHTPGHHSGGSITGTGGGGAMMNGGGGLCR